MSPALPNRLPDFAPAPGAMLFNSPEYLLVFLPLVVAGYYGLCRYGAGRGRLAWLAWASLVFYGWFSLAGIWLVCGSVLLNFSASQLIANTRAPVSRLILATAISINLAVLGYYKYADFLIGNINLFSSTQLPLLHLALPLGISFFTFTQIAYLVDVYRRQAHEYHFIHYLLFVTYFPHLIAGPILHHKEMMPQFASRTACHVNWTNVHTGLLLFSIGLLKKNVMADSLAFAADAGFGSTTPLPFHQAWIASLSYTLQLYFDFSGYTDMAIGASLLFNVRLPDNFNSPYQARNIREFWQRWHMTLSRWLRDYLYIPLGGNRHGLFRTAIALLITFLLGGLWHGPQWTFVLWGALHGSAAILHHLWQKRGMRLPSWAGWATTFLFVNIAWVFFRAESVSAAHQLLASMVGLNGFAPDTEYFALLQGITSIDTWDPNTMIGFAPTRQLLMVLLGLIMVWTAPNAMAISNVRWLTPISRRGIVLSSLLIGIAVFHMLFMTSTIVKFIYSYF